MGLALVRDREKRPVALMPARASDPVVSGTNNGFLVGACEPATFTTGSDPTISRGWVGYASGNNVFYGGALSGSATLAVSAGAVVIAGSVAEPSHEQYRPEVLRKLHELAALPLDDAAPEGEREFMDWLNSD